MALRYDRWQPLAIEGGQLLESVAAVGRVLRRQLLDLLERRRVGRLRVTPMDRGQILRALKILGLTAPLAFVEPGANEIAPLEGLGAVAEQSRQPKIALAMLGRLSRRVALPAFTLGLQQCPGPLLSSLPVHRHAKRA